jgi:hypothetical protein
MKPGDLVKRKEGCALNPHRLGLVVSADCAIVKVKWSDDYGTFSHPASSLEVISEAR